MSFLEVVSVVQRWLNGQEGWSVKWSSTVRWFVKHWLAMSAAYFTGGIHLGESVILQLTQC